MAKVLGLKQLMQKRYQLLEGLDPKFKESFGELEQVFVMLVWGTSGQGKSNFLMQFVREICKFGKVLYVGLEEGHTATMQRNVLQYFTDEHLGLIEFANHEMTYVRLCEKLRKKKSPKFIVIDSLQYWNIDYEQYKELKEAFPKKSFLFISHAKGKNPDGVCADKIRYDAGLKVFVEKGLAFVTSRYGGNKVYVIGEAFAKKKWGKEYKKQLNR